MTISAINTMISNRVSGTPNPIITERALWTAIVNECMKMYEVKEIDVNLVSDPDYLTNNFDATGLGKNDMLGFAICNGQNGTRNRGGRAAVGYGGVPYSNIGELIGSPDTVLPEHSHTVGIKRHTNSGGVIGLFDQANGGATENFTTSTVGVSGTGKNIPPSIITLMIQRIA